MLNESCARNAIFYAGEKRLQLAQTSRICFSVAVSFYQKKSSLVDFIATLSLLGLLALMNLL